ncbi:MAG: hypothetical protein WCK02_09840 [Bacteroidota bacterium]
MLLGRDVFCSCSKGEFSISEYLNYDAVFTGELVLISKDSLDIEWNIKLKLIDKYRGVLDDTISVYNSWAFSNGVDFELNKKYLVSAAKNNNKLWTSCCDRTVDFESSDFPDYLKKILVFLTLKTFM